MSRERHDQGVGGGIAATNPSGRFAAIASEMKAFRKIVPNLGRTGRNTFDSTTNNSAPPRCLAVRPPRELTTKSTNGNANLQRPNGSGRYVLDQKQKTQCASRRFSSGFVCDDEEELPYLSPATKTLRPIPTPPSKSSTHCTTTHESPSLASETDDDAEEEDEDDEDDESGEEEDEDEDDDDDDGDEDEDEEEKEDNDDDEDVDGDDGEWDRDRGHVADIFPQLRDHNPKSVKVPRSFESGRSTTQFLTRPTDPEPEAALLAPPLTRVRQSADTRDNTQPPKAATKRTTLREDAFLYESIKARYDSSVSKPSTVFVSRLPEPWQIREATRTFRENREKRSHKRKAWEQPVPVKALPKRQTREDMRRKSTVFELDNTRNESHDSGGIVQYAERDRNLDPKRGHLPFPLPSSPQRPPSPPPISESRVVMQFTVFRTRGLPRSFDGYLAGKVVRSGSYADRNTANKRAEALLRLKGPPVARMEFEYGEEGSSRNGMFFGRAEYKNGTCLYVYVDCEYQQFGKIDPSEFDGKLMNPQYKQLCLAPRYDVFVILRKAMRSQDGIMVYEYEEKTRPEAVTEEIDDDDSDIESSHEKGTEIENEDRLAEAARSSLRAVDSPVQDDDSDRTNEVTTTKSLDESIATKDSDENDTLTTPDEVGEESSFAGHDVNVADYNCVDGNESNASQSGIKNDNSRPSVHESSLGSHFQPIFFGSYTTLAEANAKAVDAFAVKTRPQQPARLDALVYYRDILQPHLRQLRLQFCEDLDTREATKEAEISWEPSPQFRYDYEAINVVVAKSEMQGPLDLTGAFS